MKVEATAELGSRLAQLIFVSVGLNRYSGLMKNSIIYISAFSLVAMMLASCESIPSSLNPFASETTTTSISDSPVTSQTNRPVYDMPLGRSPEHFVPTSY